MKKKLLFVPGAKAINFFPVATYNLLVETIPKNGSVVMLAAGYNKPEVINAHGGSVGNLKSQIRFL